MKKNNIQTVPLNYRVIQYAMLFWLLGWFIKISFFADYLAVYIFAIPIRHDLFPTFFVNPYVAVFFYYLPTLAFPAILLPTRNRLIFSNLIFLGCSLVLMNHIDTYNDATFVTSFWVSLWLLWFSINSDRKDDAVHFHAKILAQCIIGMIFLGGFVGKLTPQYFSGEAFYNIFFHKDAYWPHSWLRTHYSVDQIKIYSQYFSWSVMVMEFLLYRKKE